MIFPCHIRGRRRPAGWDRAGSGLWEAAVPASPHGTQETAGETPGDSDTRPPSEATLGPATLGASCSSKTPERGP